LAPAFDRDDTQRHRLLQGRRDFDHAVPARHIFVGFGWGSEHSSKFTDDLSPAGEGRSSGANVTANPVPGAGVSPVSCSIDTRKEQ
jgi:hypothetical protein